MLKIAWGASGALALAGLAVMATNYSPERAFALGIATLIIGSMVGAVTIVCARLRTLDDEYQAGYRMGYRCGRKDGLSPTVSPIRRAERGISAFNKKVLGSHAATGRTQLDRHDSARR